MTWNFIHVPFETMTFHIVLGHKTLLKSRQFITNLVGLRLPDHFSEWEPLGNHSPSVIWPKTIGTSANGNKRSVHLTGALSLIKN